MRKGLFVFLSLALVVALAVPAAAEMKLTGFYRVKPTVSNFLTASTPKEFNTPGTVAAGTGSLTKELGNTSRDTTVAAHFTEMRARLRFEVGDENVKGVTFFEIDGNFGDTGGKIGRNEGFASNGDSVNLETKQVFVWFKVPDTPLSFTVGLQGYSDMIGGMIFNGSDQPGVVANLKFDPVALRFSWIKLRGDFTFGGIDPVQQGAGLNTNRADADADYYAADATFTPAPIVGVTAHFAVLRDTKNAVTDIAEAVGADNRLLAYYLGAKADFKIDPVTLSASLLYNFGTIEQNGGLQDVDIEGYAVRLRADAKLGPGNLFAEGLYISGDDDATAATTTSDAKYKSVITGSNFAPLTAFYTSADLYILFPNGDDTNSAGALVLNPNNFGRGVILLAAGYNQKFTDKLAGKVGLGYLMADKNRTTAANEPEGKDMGAEINANVNYNISKGLDFGLYGAYAMLGSFYDRGKAGSGSAGEQSPDDLYKFHARLNYAF